MQHFLLEPVAGTIVAWVPSTEEPDPPERWVICDGRPIGNEGEGGPFEGKNTPDLRKKFLIGEDSEQVKVCDSCSLLFKSLVDDEDNQNLKNIPLEKYRSISGEPYNLNTFGVVYIMRVK